MKKLLGSVFVAASLLALPWNSQAQTLQLLSVQFGNTVTSGMSAGVLPDSHFNSDTMSATYFSTETTGVSNLHDSNLNSTTISETKTDYGTYHQGGAVTGFSNAANNALFNGANCLSSYSGSPGVLTLTGLSMTASYNLYLYVQDPNGAAGDQIQATLGAQSYYLNTISSDAMNSFVRGTAVTAATATAGNYFEFTGLTGATTQTVNFTTGGFEFVGFQLQQVAVAGVPEPSTVGMMFAGSIVFAGFMLRRRKLVSL